MAHVRKKCKGTAAMAGTKRRRACQINARAGSDYCAWHDPAREQKLPTNPDNGYLMAARRALLLEDSLAAVRLIATGHQSDPVMLCRNVLTRFTRECEE